VVDEVLTQIGKRSLQRPVRIYSGAFVTTLNAPGVSITLMNVTKAAKQASETYPVTEDDILEHLDAPHASFAWVSTVKSAKNLIGSTDELMDLQVDLELEEDIHSDIKVQPELLQKVLRGACESMSAAEPDLTKWDTIVGDGDCGETVKLGADGESFLASSPCHGKNCR
jgi:dihydroxyacetone kinase